VRTLVYNSNAPPHRLPIYSQSTVHPSTLNPARRITAPVSRNNHASTAFPKIHGLASFRRYSFADVAQPRNRRNSHPQLNREIPRAARQGYWVRFRIVRFCGMAKSKRAVHRFKCDKSEKMDSCGFVFKVSQIHIRRLFPKLHTERYDQQYPMYDDGAGLDYTLSFVEPNTLDPYITPNTCLYYVQVIICYESSNPTSLYIFARPVQSNSVDSHKAGIASITGTKTGNATATARNVSSKHSHSKGYLDLPPNATPAKYKACQEGPLNPSFPNAAWVRHISTAWVYRLCSMGWGPGTGYAPKEDHRTVIRH
jgi:hypothetical protein